MDTERLRSLLNTNVHVLGVMTDTGQVAFQNGRAHFGTAAIPFFTSTQILLDAVDVAQQCLSMPAKTFFELTAGSRLVLNPKSADRQEFSPEQVSAVMHPQLDAQGAASKFRSILGFKNS
jgi:hypothetical protein